MTIDRHPESLKALIRSHLKATGWEIFEVSYDSIADLSRFPLETVDAVFLAPARHFPTEHMDRLETCRLMQIWSSGYDKFNAQDAHSRGIHVANNHGSNAVSVAEHAIFMLLGVSRRAPEMHLRVTSGEWAGNDHGMSSYSVAGKNLGIVGLGNIGSLVARRAEALDMNILFSDPSPTPNAKSGWKRTTFIDLLETADYLSFHVHLTADTRAMLNLNNLHHLKRQPFLVNVSRAELVDRAALERALSDGLLRGAALDAHYSEPTSAADSLWQHRNLFLSPHVAGSTVDSYISTVTSCVDNIQRAMAGQTPRGSVSADKMTPSEPSTNRTK